MLLTVQACDPVDGESEHFDPILSDRFRFQTSATVRYEVVRDLQLGVEFYEQYDSRPLDGGAALNDFRVATTIGYVF